MCGIAFIAINILLDPISKEVLNFAVAHLSVPSLTLSEPSFKNSRISSHNAITWEDISLTAISKPSDASKKAFKAIINAEELTVEATWLIDGLFMIRLKGLNITADFLPKEDSAAGKDAPEILTEGNLAVPIRLTLTSFAAAASQIRSFVSEVKRFSEEGETVLPIKLMAEEITTIGGDSFSVSLGIKQSGTLYRLVGNEDDLRLISESILPNSQTSTAADLEIIANNPLRASRLLKIRVKASGEAASAHERDPKVPENAYRHVLWSYLLTREYGADFAKKVTDAHEITMDPEEKYNPNAAAYHNLDYKDNEVGRKYATRGYSESNVLELVMTDPEVIRRIEN
jgi:hypothetical protein